MQELRINLGPTRANIVAWRQLGVNMYLGNLKNECFASTGARFSQNCTFHRGHALEGLGEALGGLGTSWVDVWESLGVALVGLGGTLEDLLGGPWKNLGRSSWKSLLNPR